MPKFSSAVALTLIVAVAFMAGVTVSGPATLSAQDRGPQRPIPGPTPPPKENAAPAPMVWNEGSGASSSSNGMIAVTGSYGVGSSVLYVIDTNTKQLAVYEARGGSPNASRVFLVGARRIDLDLQLQGYNDLSEHNYEQLQRKFAGLEKASKSSAADNPIPTEGRR